MPAIGEQMPARSNSVGANHVTHPDCPDPLSWQITPRVLTDAIADPDPAEAQRAFAAMMQMRKIDIAAIEAARRG